VRSVPWGMHLIYTIARRSIGFSEALPVDVHQTLAHFPEAVECHKCTCSLSFDVVCCRPFLKRSAIFAWLADVIVPLGRPGSHLLGCASMQNVWEIGDSLTFALR